MAKSEKLRTHVIEKREEQVIVTSTLNSQRKASANYEKNKIEQLTVRLPKGSREKLNKYISDSGKYSSVNSMIKTLIETEIGYSLD